MVLGIVAGVAVLLALVALGLARRANRRFDALNQSYWELRYDFTRLRARVSRLDPEEKEEAAPPQAPTQVAFVPLSSMKKKHE